MDSGCDRTTQGQKLGCSQRMGVPTRGRQGAIAVGAEQECECHRAEPIGQSTREPWGEDTGVCCGPRSHLGASVHLLAPLTFSLQLEHHGGVTVDTHKQL